MINGQYQSNAEFIEAYASYLANLQSELRPHITDEKWADLFRWMDTPEEASRTLWDRAAEERSNSPNFGTVLELSTGHLRKGDCDLLEGYRGPDADSEWDRDPGQSLFVTPCVGGWIISTAGCFAPAPKAALSPEEKALREKHRHTTIANMKAEGFSDEFVALFSYACENRVADIRFDRAAADLLDFPIFDW